MENENKKVDYGKAVSELSQKSSVETFKPKVGSVFVDILEEPVETQFKAMDGKETPQIKLRVNVAGKNLVWYVSKGITFRSLYGQLMALGKGENGLAGKKVQLLVKSSKNKEGKDTNDYTIVEAVKYLPTVEEAV